MTVGELVAELKDYDQDAIVCTGGNDSIRCTECLPAYWDGRLTNIIENEFGNPIKVEINGKGTKVKIHSYDTEDVIFENPRIEVEVESNSKGSLDTYAKWRQDGLDYEKGARERYDHYDYLKKYDDMLFIWDMEGL